MCTSGRNRRRSPPPGGTGYEPCYDDPPAAAEANDQAAAVDEQIFPAYDQYDPGPGYDGFTNRRAPVISCPAERSPGPLSCDEICHGMNLDFAAGPVKMRA